MTNGTGEAHDEGEAQSMFTPVKPVVSNNYMIVDTIYQSAPASHLGVPGPDGDGYDLGFNGLSAVSDEIKALLPPECLVAFNEALAKELEWKKQWGTESSSTLRKAPAIDKGVV